MGGGDSFEVRSKRVPQLVGESVVADRRGGTQATIEIVGYTNSDYSHRARR